MKKSLQILTVVILIAGAAFSPWLGSHQNACFSPAGNGQTPTERPLLYIAEYHTDYGGNLVSPWYKFGLTFTLGNNGKVHARNIVLTFESAVFDSLDGGVFTVYEVDAENKGNETHTHHFKVNDMSAWMYSGTITAHATYNDPDGNAYSDTFTFTLSIHNTSVEAVTITALTDTTVLEISKEHFEHIFRSSPSMARSILHTLIGIVRETDRRAIEDLEQRYREIAEAYAGLEAAQRDHIARAALEAQLAVAARAQRSLLPGKLPEVQGFEFAALFEPARHVGGDFYDVRPLEDGRVSVVLADVSDKGAHAALFMAVARTLFYTESRHRNEPAEVMQAVHRGLLDLSLYDMFVTAIYGVLEPQTGLFRFARAGHEEPLVVRCDGSTEFLGGRGRFLGGFRARGHRRLLRGLLRNGRRRRLRLVDPHAGRDH